MNKDIGFSGFLTIVSAVIVGMWLYNGASLALLALKSAAASVALKEVASASYPLAVDDTKTIPEMVTAGNYDWPDHGDFVRSGFLVTGHDVRHETVHLVTYNRDYTREEVKKDIEKRGLRLASLDDCLAFGKRYIGESERKYWIGVVCLKDVVSYGDGPWNFVAEVGTAGSPPPYRRQADLVTLSDGPLDHTYFRVLAVGP